MPEDEGRRRRSVTQAEPGVQAQSFAAMAEDTGRRRSVTTADPGIGVRLHIYDVGQDESVAKANDWLKAIGTGAFHTAVEVYGEEWGFGATEDPKASGIYCSHPGKDPNHRYREAMSMGSTALTSAEVQALLTKLRRDWKGGSYDILHHNCTHFCTEFCVGLGVDELPPWATNLAGVGCELESVGVAALPVFELIKSSLRPWGDLAACSLPESWDQVVERASANIIHFHANYWFFIVVFLILMLFSHPTRLIVVILAVVAWVLFLRSKAADENWKPKLKDVEITVEHRFILMMCCSIIVLAMVAGNSLFFCAVLVLVHSVLHPGLRPSLTSSFNFHDKVFSKS